MENGSTKYLRQLKSYSRGENEVKTNWNTFVLKYNKSYYQLIFT